MWYSNRVRPYRLAAAACVVIALTGSGCGSSKSVSARKPDATTARSIIKPTALAAGDELELKFYYAPELNDTQVVRPDGRISLQLVGEVEARGLTPAQLTENLKELYGAHLRYPEVTVILREIRQRRVYVSGAVQRPGLVELPGELTLFEAIAEAGGFDLRTAETGSVLVVRHDESGKRIGYKVNLKPMLKGEVSDPFYLQPQDIIFVPRTAIADVNQFIDQYINQVIPRTGFFYSAPVGNGTMGIDTSSR